MVLKWCNHRTPYADLRGWHHFISKFIPLTGKEMNWCNPQIHHFISKSKTQMSEKWSGVHYSSGWRIAMLAIANKIRRIRSAAGPSQWCFFKWSSGDQTYKTTKLSVQRLFVTCLAAETLEMNWQWMMKVSEALLGRGKDPPVRGSKTSGEN